MAASSNDTYAGALEVLIKQIATMKGLPDANLPFLIKLETMVLGEIRNPERMMAAAGILPPEQANPQGMEALGMPQGGGMAAPPPSMLGAGNAGPGMAMSPSPANPDEMRRILTSPGT